MPTSRKIIYKDYDPEKKCGCCNYQATRFYCFERQNIEEFGLCGHCFLDFMVDEELNISHPLAGSSDPLEPEQPT